MQTDYRVETAECRDWQERIDNGEMFWRVCNRCNNSRPQVGRCHICGGTEYRIELEKKMPNKVECKKCLRPVEPLVKWVRANGGDRDVRLALFCPRCTTQIRAIPKKQTDASKWKPAAGPEPAPNLQFEFGEPEPLTTARKDD